MRVFLQSQIQYRIQSYTLKTSYAVRPVHKYALKDNPSLNSSPKPQILQHSDFSQYLNSIINDQ